MRTTQSPPIVKSSGALYRPGSTSFASAKTGDIPACVMSPSRVTRAPDTGFAASDKLMLIVAGPTLGGCGEMSYETTTEDAGSADLWQAPARSAAAHAKDRAARRKPAVGIKRAAPRRSCPPM